MWAGSKLPWPRGVDVNIRNDYGFTPLNAATDTGNLAVAQVLVDNGADINAAANDGDTPLHSVNLAQYYQTVNSLKTIMHPDIIKVEASPGHIAVVQLLINKGGKIDQQNSRGYTPLHLMVDRGMLKVAEVLLHNGANPWVPNKEGQLPPCIAWQTMAMMG